MKDKRIGLFGKGIKQGIKITEDNAVLEVHRKIKTDDVNKITDQLNIFNYSADKDGILSWLDGFYSLGMDIDNKYDVFCYWFLTSLFNDIRREHFTNAIKTAFGDEDPYIPSFQFWSEEVMKALRETFISYNCQGNKRGFEEILHKKIKRCVKHKQSLKFFYAYAINYLRYYETETNIKIK